MFDLHGIERLTAWKLLRDELETCEEPLILCAKSWSKAPYVSEYLDPYDPDSWPDPWRLVIDGRFDNLAISLGMLYTLRLTKKFSDCDFEIFRSERNKRDNDYFLKVADLGVLNMSYGEVEPIIKLQDYKISKVYPKNR